MFVWAIGILLVVIAAAVSYAASSNAKTDSVIDRTSKIETKLEVLVNDVGWIREKLERLDTKSGAYLKAALMEIVLATTSLRQ